MRLLKRILKCRCQLFLRSGCLAFCLFFFSILVNQRIAHFRKDEEKKELYLIHSDHHHLQFVTSGLTDTSFNTTCSLNADRRGPNQRVIGYSIFGNLSHPNVFRQYLKPFVKTLKEIPFRYPG
jgi:hypothetical protein